MSSLINHWANQSQISNRASVGKGNESLFGPSGSHDQDGRHAYVLKIFFSGTKGSVALGLGVQHLGHWAQ